MSGEGSQEFTDADLASVVQQAMEGFADGQLEESQQQDEQHEQQHTEQAQNNVDTADDDFEQEVQRQLEAQFQQHSVHQGDENANINAVANDDDDDDFAKEVERQLQEQMDQQLSLKDDQQQQIQPHGKSQQDEKVPEPADEPVVDYEQELQRQIMDALGNGGTNSSAQQVDNDNDFEQDLQKQIMEAFNASEEASKMQPGPEPHSRSQPQPQSRTVHAVTSNHHAPAQQDRPSQRVPQLQTKVRDQRAQDDYELQLQKQIMEAFAASSEMDQRHQQEAQEAEQAEFSASFEQELQNQIMQAFNESQAEHPKKQYQLIQEPQSQPQPQVQAELTHDDDDLFKDALAELVKNVVDAQAESEATQQGNQSLQTTGDDEDIDMNQIMQNALALAVEDPNALLQSLNISGEQPIDNAFLGQMIQQTQEQAAKEKKKLSKAPKEKKTPKEKKPRQPRKTTKKKKEVATVSQVPNFVPNPQFSITGIPFPQNLQHLPQSLQIQFQQQIQQQQQQLYLLQRQQQIESQQQQSPQQQGLLSSDRQGAQTSQPKQQQQHQQEQAHRAQAIQNVPQKKGADLGSKPEPKHPKPAPANSIVDSLKKVPPLMLLSRDTSNDLANSAKQKKASLSIAETLALSRQAMSSGKFSSKLHGSKSQEQSPSPSQSSQQTSEQEQQGQGQQQDVPQHDLAESDVSQQQAGTQQIVQLQVIPQQQEQQSQQEFGPEFGIQELSTQKDHSVPDVYTFSADDQAEKHSLENALNLANQMFAKQDDSVMDGGDNSSKMTSGVGSPQLPVAPGTQGNALLNNIGTLLPNLPSHLTTLISSAISQALSSNLQQSLRKEQTKNLKKKQVPVKDETPEQQKERVRLENRERKKRWRDANKLKNQNNDLRARLKKRAIHLYGHDDSDEKTEWIEAEFEKRKNRRLIKSANLEDLTMVISETMNKLDIQSVNEETLSRVIGQIVTSSLNNQSHTQQQVQPRAQPIQQQQQQQATSQVGSSGSDLDGLRGLTKGTEDLTGSDLDLSKLIAASNNDDLTDPQLQHLGAQQFQDVSHITLDEHNSRPVEPVIVSHQPTGSLQQQQEEQLQELQLEPQQEVQQEPQQELQHEEPDELPHEPQQELEPKSQQSHQHQVPEEAVVVAEPVTKPKKRSSDVLSTFNVKRAKIPLIRLGMNFDDSTTKNELTGTAESVSAVGRPSRDEKPVQSIEIGKANSPSDGSTASTETGTSTLTPSKLAPQAAPPVSTPLPSRSVVKTKPAPPLPSQIPRGSIKIPSFKKSEATQPTTIEPVAVSPVPSVLKKEKLLMRPKFGGGLRKPSAFNGLRKPGFSKSDKPVGA